MKFIVFLVIIALLSCNSSKLTKVNNSGADQIQNISPDTLTKDRLIKFNARPEMGFNFDYLIYLPKGLSFGTLFLWPTSLHASGRLTRSKVDGSLRHVLVYKGLFLIFLPFFAHVFRAKQNHHRSCTLRFR